MNDATENRSARMYLLLRDRHAVPITDLAPERLKQSVKSKSESLDVPIRHTTALNAVAKGLGFRGGFPGYIRRGYSQVCAFLEKHGMRQRADLFSNSLAFAHCFATREALSGRLFHSGKSLPRRVFLATDGFDSDIFAPAGEAFHHAPHYRRMSRHELEARAETEPRALHLLIARYHWQAAIPHTVINLLGDAIVDPSLGEGIVYKLYWESDYDPCKQEQEREELRASWVLVRRALEQSECGWIDVLPFNDNLAFLCGRNGAYDFVFRNLRSTPPPPLPCHPHLDADDVPTALWRSQGAMIAADYYRLDQWRDQEDHLAEEHYYATGGRVRRYPGWASVKCAYLEATDRSSALPNCQPESCPSGFTKVVVGGRLVYASQLVTIGQFRRFAERSGYLERRRSVTRWEDANGDPEHLPVAVTWYDAQAYIRHVEETLGYEARLLTRAEYRALHPGAESRARNRVTEGCVQCYHGDGKPVTWWGVGSDYGPIQFIARFKPDLPWRDGPGGVRFLCSDGFGEWLADHEGTFAAAINTRDLGGMGECRDMVDLSRFPADSWGSYQVCKIGFRVCF
ncbi:MAG: SUMF1/EgtB/PvdO family nonheme iron enzyme [Proteobacteria bacterium]|nr:SUMF1/EgtB/PvdO family nonheme iron enzyme [Pseudomonadota bacterium]